MVLFPCVFGGSIKVFFMFEFFVAMIIVMTAVVGLVHTLGGLAESFIFDGEFDVLDVLKDSSCASHEPIEKNARVG